VSGEVQLLINTPLGKFTQVDDYAHPARRAGASGAVYDDMSAASARV